MVRNLIRAKKEGQDEIHLAPLSGNLMDRHSPPKNDQNISLFGGNVKSGKRESSPPYFHAFHLDDRGNLSFDNEPTTFDNISIYENPVNSFIIQKGTP